MSYPKVLSEDETLDLALAGRSLARYGDGELRVILGGNCISQIKDHKLGAELRQILTESGPCLPCIPNVNTKSPKRKNWEHYATSAYTQLYKLPEYGSSFISRPDSAPWIDRHDYWDKVKQFWIGKDVVLVKGTERSLRVEMLTGAKSIRCVETVRRDCYAEIDRIEEEIGKPSGPILLCVGCTSTVLASRLAKKGLWAIDLGHIGMMMRSHGAFGVHIRSLISGEYQQAQRKMHTNPEGYGGSGHKQADAVVAFAKEIDATLVLDYGCGEGTLKKVLDDPKYRAKMESGITRVWEYDPGIEGKDGLSKVSELVVCTDVLEHVEPDKLDAVLKHIHSLSDKGAYIVVATRPANKCLPNGNNAHLIIQGEGFWTAKIMEHKWELLRMSTIKPSHSVTYCLRRL